MNTRLMVKAIPHSKGNAPPWLFPLVSQLYPSLLFYPIYLLSSGRVLAKVAAMINGNTIDTSA